ncbi:MAG TPA: hypothetical protein VLJ59_11230 [Mycobacteriales bacterium]|nr:hypothetical protein [Mycobacteriales bacterium]
MAQVVLDQVEQVRGCLLGLGVDRKPVVGRAVVDQVDLVVRRSGSSFAAPIDRLPDEDPVRVQRHNRHVPS